MFPEGGQAVAAFTSGPEDAKQHKEGPKHPPSALHLQSVARVTSNPRRRAILRASSAEMRKVVLPLLVLVCVAPDGSRAAPLSSGSCRFSHIAVRLGPGVREKTGQHTLILRLVNRGRSCVLDGYPVVRAYDRVGLIPFVIKHEGDQMVTSRPPRKVVVRPGRAAFVALNHYRCDRGNLRSATRLRIGKAAVRLRDPYRTITYCGKGDPGSIVAVSPLEPTRRATLAP